jgi:Segregation and condensation complex subunit ScpB
MRIAEILGRPISRDVIAVLRNAQLIATGPRSPQPGAPYTYVTTPTFLTVFGLASLRDLPDLDRLEEAGLLGTAPLPELRDVLGMRDAEDEEAEIGVVRGLCGTTDCYPAPRAACRNRRADRNSAGAPSESHGSLVACPARKSR